jgi:hypothetical protein
VKRQQPPYRGPHWRRYQVVMKSWRRLRQAQQPYPLKFRAARRHLLEELRVLDLEAFDLS